MSKKMTMEKFLMKSQKMHGIGTYNYDLVDIKNCRVKVKIFCPKPNHGIYEQSPDTHMAGHGCPKCRNEYNRIIK